MSIAETIIAVGFAVVICLWIVILMTIRLNDRIDGPSPW